MMDTTHAWILLPGAAILLILRSIYRLYFHPLSHIPGPKLAAITHLYEFYYDVCANGDGRFLLQIEKLHRKYGPIVRISPREVHVNDPDFYDEIYTSSSRRREKDPAWVPIYSTSTSMITTVGHEHHRFRRNLLNNFFSKRSVMDLTPMIQERINKLIQRFEEFHHSKTVVQLDDAFAALTADIITYYGYGKLWGFLEDKDFRSDIRAAATEVSGMCHINRLFPFLDPLVRSTPGWMVRLLAPGKTAVLDLQQSILDTVMDSASQEAKPSKATTLVHKLIDPELPPEERTKKRIEEESLIFLAAGTETTGRTLTIASYHLARNMDVLERLREEVKTVLPTTTSTCTLLELERLPYLTAVLNEALRITTPAMNRFPRVAPDETLVCGEYPIPPGTPMGSSPFLIHRNATIFPNPEKFDPDRWIRTNGKTATGERLDRYLTAFTKGSRACLGIKYVQPVFFISACLAYAELYMALAHLARRVEFGLHNTGPEDVQICREFVIGYTKRAEPRVYARVTGVLQD